MDPYINSNIGEESSYSTDYHSLLAWATFTFTQGEVDLLVSRKFLFDKDLVRKSEVQPEDFDSFQAFTPEESLQIKMEQTTIEEKVEAGFTPPEMVKIDFSKLKLPTQFGPTYRSSGKPHKKKKRVDTNKWASECTFEEYWEHASYYVLYRLWLDQFGDIMDPPSREQLEKDVFEYKSNINGYLIEEHKKFTNYRNIVKSHPKYSEHNDYQETFNLHCQLVEKKSRSHFEAAKANFLASKCKLFLRKIESLGVVTGYQDAEFDPSTSDESTIADDEEDVQRDKTEEQNEKQEHASSDAKRKPVVYSDNEVFSDVLYEIYDPTASKMKMVLNRGDNRAKESDSNENKGHDTSEENIASASSVDLNFSFAFDPENDKHLIAQDAYKIFKHDPEIRKYWYQRYRLFTKLNKGIIMDREGWFSVTPERIAEHIAYRMVRYQGAIVMDAFAGVGGNSIQLAMKGAYVIAIDLDPVRLKCAKRNAEVYGVADRIEFICGNFFHIASHWTEERRGQGEVDAVFLSPPWGGPSYLQTKEFDLATGCTPNGFEIFKAARLITPNIAFFLPRNTIMQQLISLAGTGGRVEVEQSCLNKKIKTITAYYGELCIPSPVAENNTTESC